MNTFARLGVILLLIAAALPFVAARCKDGEFWFPDKSCCLPYGGPPGPPSPPPDKDCPPYDWSWSDEQGCCVPHYPSPPPPQCDNDWDWSDPDFCCKKHHRPKPSGYWKRAVAKRASDVSGQTSLCPMGLAACPIADANGPTSDFECLDTANELESCGGCASIDQGYDCTAITGAWNVGCERGGCAVYTCAGGFKRSHDGTKCTAI